MRTEMITQLNDLFQGFNIKATCVNAHQHRHFSYYDVELDQGTRISRLSRYSAELALALRTKSALIVSAIPDRGIVRLRAAHASPEKISFNDLYRSSSVDEKAFLPFILGETDEGKSLCVDMSKNPHLLVAGATGSGKSVFLHTLIANCAKRCDTKLSLIDTKLVEFGIYNNTMKSLIRFRADSYDNAILLLERMQLMMESRYQYLAQYGFQSVEEIPYLFDKQLIIIDEVADLMLQDKKSKKFESLIVSLAQKARAAGIYLVLATQRPSVDVLTGLIKSNFPARLACRVSSKIDSRVVLDQHGAENLIGRGDAMLKLPGEDTIRFQVAFTNPKETIQEYRRSYCSFFKP